MPCVNKGVPNRTLAEIREYYKQYQEAHREEIRERKKQYQEAHREEIREYKKQYREAHREEMREHMRQYRARKKARDLLIKNDLVPVMEYSLTPEI
jgi:hypothetical protein